MVESLSGKNSESSARVLFLANVQSYRAAAFWKAGQALGIECRMAVDMEPDLAASGKYGWGFPFSKPEEAVKQILSAHAKKPWTSIVALDDSGGEIAARACQALDLPHNSPSAAAAARDKFEMRRLLFASGLASPLFKKVAYGDDLEVAAESVGWPLVVKPLDRNGSQGVMRVNNPEELESAVTRLQSVLQGKQSTERHPFLMESYIPGAEFAVEALIADRELHVLAIFDKPDPLEGPFFEESIYTTPSRESEANQELIIEATRLAAQALGLGIGPIHAEMRLNSQGVWILEVAARSIGGHCSQALKFGTAESLESLILRQACGMPIPSLAPQGSGSGVMMIPIPEAGIFQGIDGLDAAGKIADIVGIEITAREGYTLKPLPEGNSYLGFIFADAASPSRAEEALREAHGCLGIRMQPEIELTAG